MSVFIGLSTPPISQLFMDVHHSSHIDPLPAFSFVVGPIWSAPIFSTALSGRASLRLPAILIHLLMPAQVPAAVCQSLVIANAAGVGTRSTPLISSPVSSARETSQLRSSSRLELELELSRTALRLGLPADSESRARGAADPASRLCSLRVLKTAWACALRSAQHIASSWRSLR
jgi:hypothetical protein